MSDDQRSKRRPDSGSFLPKNLPEERWGLLLPAAIALALLLIVAIVVVRFNG